MGLFGLILFYDQVGALVDIAAAQGEGQAAGLGVGHDISVGPEEQ
ncbi:hypothetical protein [Acutalibacter caecimuris]|nr:hypothetical protein [Acutalibacter sp. M00118]